MTRAVKVFLFVSAATLVNLGLTATLFFVLLGLYAFTLAKILPPGDVTWAVMACFVLAMVGSMFAYRKLIGLIRIRFKLDDILGPPRLRN